MAKNADTTYLSCFLYKYQNLTHLNIECVTDAVPNLAKSKPIIFHSLQYLSFTSTLFRSNAELLGRFRTPSLSALVLTFMRVASNHSSPADILSSSHEGVEWGSFIQPLLRSCDKTLSRFSLRGTAIPPLPLQRVLVEVPSRITALDLQYWPWGYELPEASEARLFPKLESLSIAVAPSNALPSQSATASAKALIAFLTRRIEENDLLVKLSSLEVARGDTPSDLFPDNEIEELRKRGLRVIVWAGL
jgi:hypothetical protein